MRTRFSLAVLVTLLLLGLLLPLSSNGLLLAPAAVPASAASMPAVQAPAIQTGPDPVSAMAPEQPGPQLPEPNERLQAVHTGKWPAQAAAWRGDIRPDQHGPQRNDPAEGIPVHAYSPFDERRNREYPCPPGGCDYQPGQVLVKLAPDVEAQPLGAQAAEDLTADAALNQTLAAEGVVSLEPIFPGAEPPGPQAQIANPDGDLIPEPDLTRWYRAGLRNQQADIYATVQALQDAPGIAWAEPDYLRKPVGEPPQTDPNPQQPHGSAALPASLLPSLPASPATFDDPLYAQQWHLAAVNAPQAWDWLANQDPPLPPGGNRDIVVAVIDTGVDYTHPDLAANMWVNAAEFNGNPGQDDDGNGFVDDIHGANVVSSQHSGDPQDDHGHGTHVAGIIAAQADNGIGGVGVAYNVQVMALKAAQYSGVLASTDIAEAIYYAVEKGVDVINMSFGGYARSQLEEDALAVAFGQAVLVAAAGNDSKVNLPCRGGRDMYPAAYNWVLGVMASTSGGSRAGFSNYDCKPHDSHEYELMAPGVDVWSTLPGGGQPAGQYAAWDGTSMAAPVVSGIAALARTKWADKDVYSSRFIMGQIAANASGGFGGVADGLAALTVAPQPKLTYLQHWLFDTTAQSATNDDDGIVDAGETVDLAIVIRNHWGKADPVSVKLEPWAEGAFQPDPYVTMITDTVDYGAVGSFNQDDNGLIYDAEGAIIGVLHPFRFSVDPNTPNDHVIPFRLTMTASNGYDPGMIALTFVSRFYLIVQRGRELPRIISQDMTLTKDNLWLIPDATLIEAGVRVAVTDGTQIQFFSSTPRGPYDPVPHPKLQVEGSLLVQGSDEEPVEIFPSLLTSARPVIILQIEGGDVELRYVRVTNPDLGKMGDPYGGGAMAGPLAAIDHAYFSQSLDECVDGFGYNGTWGPCYGAVFIRAWEAEHSIFHRLGRGQDMGLSFRPSGRWQENLFDSCVSIVNNFARLEQYSVFLKNYKGSLGSAIFAGRAFVAEDSLQFTGAVSHDNKTYVLLSRPVDWDRGSGESEYRGFYLDLAEEIAVRLGGHIATINDAAENAFVSSFIPNRAHIGLTDREIEGKGLWISGESSNYRNYHSSSPNTKSGDFVSVLSGQWFTDDRIYWPILLELPGTVLQQDLDLLRQNLLIDGDSSGFTKNAILNVWHNPNTNTWLRLGTPYSREYQHPISGNYWGTTSSTLIDAAITDYNDDFNAARYIYQPILTEPLAEIYPFVVDVRLTAKGASRSSTLNGPTPVVSTEPVTFTVVFNRDMNTTAQVPVSFGPDIPMTDYTIHPVEGGWQDARTWVGTFNVTPVTGDGYQLIRVAGARAADDPWLVTGDDAGRFRFEIITSGAESMNLQATGGEGYVDLSWMQDDFDLLAGYNLYRATSENGAYTRINPSLIPIQTHAWRDTNVTPGIPYYYKFTVVKSDMTESDYSNTTTAAPLDTIPPSLAHTAIADAQPGLPLTLFADATDNVAVQTVTLFYRGSGATSYASKNMVRTSGNRYAATLEGSLLAPPGIDYYIEASDGVSTARSGRPEYPHHVVVSDRPVVTSVSPPQGPATGGTAITIAGANFKAGAGVALGGTPCANVSVASGSQITCLTPAHFPAAADVTVTNPGGASGTLLRGFTFLSTTASLSLPHTGGGQNALVQVPVNAANVQGLTAASLKVTFDSAVLRPTAAAAGSLTSGWGLSANTTVAGEVRLALASPGGSVTGAGVLATITFEVIGSPGQSTALTLANALLNDGAIPVETAAGSFQVDQIYDVAGVVRFWNGGQGVPGVLLTLEGSRLYSTSTTGAGNYTVSGAAAGNYVLTPEKSTDANGITAYDASLALQHDVGLITLSGNAAIAGDVNKSGAITSMDAFYILQKSVDLITLPFPGAGVVWSFSPATRAYTNLAANQSSQDFTAVLLGDISGNWTPPTGSAQEGSQTGPWMAARWDAVAPDGTRTAHLLFFSAGQPSYSLDLDLRFDPAVLALLEANAGAATAGSLFTSNGTTPGWLHLALAQGLPLASDPVRGSEVAVLRFRPSGANATSTLELAAGRVNEEAAALRWQAGPSQRFIIHLPMLSR